MTDATLQQILDSIPGLVHTLTPSGEVELVNQRILEFFGLPAAELRDWSRLTHPDDIERVSKLLDCSLRTGEMFEVESRGRRADGCYRWLHARGTPLRDERGVIVRWFQLLIDIDDRKRAEEALRASEQNLRLMVDSIAGLICTSTRQGEVEYVNQTLLDYTGRTLQELYNWPIVVHPEDLPLVAQSWQQSIASGAPFNVELRMRRADGVYRWFMCRGLPVRTADGQILRWYSLLTDIEDRKAAEAMMRARERDRARIARATQVATVGELSASIAHEINQPLLAVLANGHACRRWLTSEPVNIPRALLSMDRIVRDAKAAADIIQRIRALHRQAPPSKDALSLNEVIEEVCGLLESDLRRRCITMHLDLQALQVPILADRVQLQQVLSNLLRNAIEALDRVSERTREIEISSSTERERVVVHVRDTGEGMDDFAQAFDPFFTTKSNGMGMGLAICRSIVEAHGGRMWGRRAKPCGSIFSFSLPAGALILNHNVGAPGRCA
jgi:hypothetical protein